MFSQLVLSSGISLLSPSPVQQYFTRVGGAVWDITVVVSTGKYQSHCRSCSVFSVQAVVSQIGAVFGWIPRGALSSCTPSTITYGRYVAMVAGLRVPSSLCAPLRAWLIPATFFTCCASRRVALRGLTLRSLGRFSRALYTGPGSAVRQLAP